MKHINVTQWFKPDQRPAHVGFYESYSFHPHLAKVRYWDGSNWCLGWPTNNFYVFRDYFWRGLAEKP